MEKVITRMGWTTAHKTLKAMHGHAANLGYFMLGFVSGLLYLLYMNL